MSNEDAIWSGCSSQVINLKPLFISGAVALAMLAGSILLYMYTGAGAYSWLPLIVAGGALLYAAVRWFDVRCTRYELTSQRLRTSRGILNKRIDELELYRIKDIALRKPLLQRMLGLGDVELTTSDHTSPVVLIRAIRQSESLRDQIRQCVERERDRKKVKEVDFN